MNDLYMDAHLLKSSTEKQEDKIEHADMVSVLAKDGGKIAAELTGNDAHLLHMAVGIAGEAGELLDAIKKGAIYRKEYDIANIVEELGDLEFYMEGLRQGISFMINRNITREDTLNANIAKLGKRYKGFKYTDSAAQNRADKNESN